VGLQGHDPETVDPDLVRSAWTAWPDGAPLLVAGTTPVPFARADIAFEPRTRLPGHPNAMTLQAWDAAGAVLAEDTYYSIGGGFIRREGAAAEVASTPFPLQFSSAAELLALCDERGLTIAEAARRNEEALRAEEEIAAGLDAIWDAMKACVDAGLHPAHTGGVLPGILRVKRRARRLARPPGSRPKPRPPPKRPCATLNWLPPKSAGRSRKPRRPPGVRTT